MPYIGIRISATLEQKINEAVKARGTDKSELIRSILEDNLQIHPTEDWEVIAWNLFTISADQFKYAFRNARTTEEFFSSVGKWAKHLQLKVFHMGDDIGVSIKYSEKMVTVRQPRNLPKVEGISKMVRSLDQALQDAILEIGMEAQHAVEQGHVREDSSGPGPTS